MTVVWQVDGGVFKKEEVKSKEEMAKLKKELSAACKLLGCGFAITPTVQKEAKAPAAPKKKIKKKATKK